METDSALQHPSKQSVSEDIAFVWEKGVYSKRGVLKLPTFKDSAFSIYLESCFSEFLFVFFFTLKLAADPFPNISNSICRSLLYYMHSWIVCNIH